jgi:hypothetical protein
VGAFGVRRLFFLIALALFAFPVTGVGGTRKPASPFDAGCAALLGTAAFLGAYPWPIRLVHRLRPAADASVLNKLNWKWTSARDLTELAGRFKQANPSLPVDMEIEVHFDPQAPADSIVLLMVFFSKADRAVPVGMASYSLRRDLRQLVEAQVESFYTDPGFAGLSGISGAVRAFMDREIYPVLGVGRETVFCDYLGRYTWAKAGYQFQNAAYFWPDGYRNQNRTLKQVQMVRENLGRFLVKHAIATTDLVVRRPDKEEMEVRDLSELNEPRDFAYLFHRMGKTVRVAPLIGENQLGPPSAMAIGKAFLLSDYRPEANEPPIFSKMGTRFSRFAMPKWRGVRTLERSLWLE